MLNGRGGLERFWSGKPVSPTYYCVDHRKDLFQVKRFLQTGVCTKIKDVGLRLAAFHPLLPQSRQSQLLVQLGVQFWLLLLE